VCLHVRNYLPSDTVPHPRGFNSLIFCTSFTASREREGLLCRIGLICNHKWLFCHVGPSCFALFAPDDVPECVELTSKLVFCFSPMAYSNNVCLDLSPLSKYDGHVMAAHCQTHAIKVLPSHSVSLFKFWEVDMEVSRLIHM